jgi:hypothetical protein
MLLQAIAALEEIATRVSQRRKRRERRKRQPRSSRP